MKRILENVEIMRKNTQYAVTNGIFLKGVFPRNYNNQIQIYLDHHSHNMDIVVCQILLILMVIIFLIMVNFCRHLQRITNLFSRPYRDRVTYSGMAEAGGQRGRTPTQILAE